MRVVEGSSAAMSQKIQAGDIISHIEGNPTLGWSLDKVRASMQGLEGTSLNIGKSGGVGSCSTSPGCACHMLIACERALCTRRSAANWRNCPGHASKVSSALPDGPVRKPAGHPGPPVPPHRIAKPGFPCFRKS